MVGFKKRKLARQDRLRREIVIFLGRNPSNTYSSAAIAESILYSHTSVKRALDGLVLDAKIHKIKAVAVSPNSTWGVPGKTFWVYTARL